MSHNQSRPGRMLILSSGGKEIARFNVNITEPDITADDSEGWRDYLPGHKPEDNGDDE